MNFSLSVITVDMIEWRTMSLLRGGMGACTFRRHTVGVVFMALVVFQSSELAQGQSPTVFQYGSQLQRLDNQSGDVVSVQVPNAPGKTITELQDMDLTCGRDFNIVNHSLVLSAAGNTTGNVSGTCLYNRTVQLGSYNSSTVNSFGVMFQVEITSYWGSSMDHGLAFFLMADKSTQDEDQDCWHLNSTSNDQASSNGHCFTVFQINFFHDDLGSFYVGSDQDLAPFDSTNHCHYFKSIVCSLRVWVEYLGDTGTLKVYILPFAFSGGTLIDLDKPLSPDFSIPIVLTKRFSNGLSTLRVGFSASILNSFGLDAYNNSVKYVINMWTFNSDGSAPTFVWSTSGGGPNNDHRRIEDSGLSQHPVVAAIVISVIMLLFPVYMVISVFYRRNTRLIALGKKYEIEHGILDRGPQKFKYASLKTATKGFSSNQLLGTGGFGSVYKANLVLKGDKCPSEVAVKRISSTSSQGAQEFLSEVRIIGQAQHRNLVRLLGWCHEKGELLLVYDYMPNGSVDQHLFRDTNDAAGDPILTWSRRLRIVSGVAAALTYLHEEWEKRVFHRDVKCSNVMLDIDFNARLGDFGLARLSEHDTAPRSTELAGTRGYMAPELFYTYKATEKTDVYSFGAMVLEVATGKKCILSATERHGSDHILLVDWVWDLYRDDTLLDAADCGLQNAFDQGEMTMFLKIGLLCSHPDPNERPCMRDVINIWKGISPFPPLPLSKPVPFKALATDALSDVLGLHSGSTSMGHSALTMPSIIEDGKSIPTEKPDVQEDGDSRSTSRFRARTIASLPY